MTSVPFPLAKNFEQAVQKRELTKDGQLWLKTCIDPFHDYQTPPTGYPDSNGCLSVCQLATRSMQLAAPVGSTANWDCVVFHSGVDCPTTFGVREPDLLAEDLWEYDSSVSTFTFDFGTIVALSADAGTVLDASATFQAANGESHALADKIADVSGRLVAIGFEVHNTTATLNKQGTITTGSMPRNRSFPTYNIRDQAVAAPHDPRWAFHDVGNMWPSTVAEAATYPDSAQWMAEKGAYCMPRLCSLQNPTEQASYHWFMWEGLPTSVVMNPIFNSTTNHTHPVHGVENNQFSGAYCFLSGLSPETTLTVTMKAYYEYFPSTTSVVSETMLPLASPSPPFDAKSIEIYAHLVARLPTSVPVGQNAKGDFWRGVLHVAGSILPMLTPIATAINPALGALVGGAGAGIRAASGAADKARARNQSGQQAPKKKKKNKKNAQTWGQPTRNLPRR